MKCKKCGKEMRIGTEQVGVDNQQLPIIHRFAYCDDCNEKTDLDANNTNFKQGKVSALSIIALIISILGCGCLSIIGLLLAIIDLLKKDGRNKVVSIIAICISVVWFGVFLLVDTEDLMENTTESTTQEVTTEVTPQDMAAEEVITEETTTEEVIVETEEEYKESCQEYAYKDVLRTPEEYIGKRIKIRVQISSVHEESILNATKYYFAYSEGEYGWYSGDYYAIFDERFNNSLKLLSDDVIYVYGEIAESEYTSSLIVMSEEVFAIKMKYVELLEE